MVLPQILAPRFHPGGFSHYYMTGPDGERSGGYWEFVAVDAPHSFEVKDVSPYPDGSPNADMPSMRMVFTFSETDSGARMITTHLFQFRGRTRTAARHGHARRASKAAMGRSTTFSWWISPFRSREAGPKPRFSATPGSRQPGHPRHLANKSGAHITNPS